jgi:hypothetical protein
MAILSDITFKGLPMKSYVNLNAFTVQKQTGSDGTLFTVRAEVFINSEDRAHLLEVDPVHFTVDTLDGLDAKEIYKQIKKKYKGQDA